MTVDQVFPHPEESTTGAPWFDSTGREQPPQGKKFGHGAGFYGRKRARGYQKKDYAFHIVEKWVFKLF